MENVDALQALCRICISKTEVDYCLYKVIREESMLSLHIMLQKLFPESFNSKQEQCIADMYMPSKICRTCKHRVLEAYELHQLCTESEARIRICAAEFQQHTADGTSPIGDHDNDTFAATPYEVTIECNYDDQLMHSEENVIIIPMEMKLETASFPVPPMNVDPSHGSLRTRQRKEREVLTRKRSKRIVKQEITYEEDETSLAVDTLRSSEEEDKLVASQLLPTSKKRNRKSSNNKRKSGSNEKGTEQRDQKKTSKTIALRVETCSEKSPEQESELQSKVDVYPCQLCDGPIYDSPAELTEHLKALHPDQIRSCDKCPKVFMSEATFQHHQYCHATGRSYFCTFCDKGFQTETLLKSHVRSHTHGAEFLCSLCGKKFNNKSNLRQHAMRHTGIKPWVCSLCPSRFCTKGALNLHQRTHTKTKAFSCDACGSQFNTRYSLIKHHLVHTGERPYSCELCPMRFVSTYHVKRHMLTHTGEKPFKCTYCERSFAQSNDMVKHMKTHVGNTPYQCDRCDESFRLLTDLRNHYKEHYQSEDSGKCMVVEDDKAIRFTSTDILKLRYDKEMGNSYESYEDSGSSNQKVKAEATEFPAMF